MTILVCLLLGFFADEPARKDVAPSLHPTDSAKTALDPEVHFRLANWYESQGKSEDRAFELGETLRLNPNHPGARGMLGEIQVDGRWIKLETFETKALEDVVLQAKLKTYDEYRGQFSESAADQIKLAYWCSGHGLPNLAKAHFAAAVRRDPTQAEAWRKLGYHAVQGRWTTEARETQARHAEAEAKLADHRWRTHFAVLAKELSAFDIPLKVKAELATIRDPLAAPSVWGRFVGGPGRFHDVAAQLFGQIDGPEATSRLALLAIFDAEAPVRSLAVAAIVKRDAREFIGPVISYLRPPLKIELTPFVGPGQPGAILVDGQVFREYAVPSLGDYKAALRPPMAVAPMDPNAFSANPGLYLAPGNYQMTSMPADPSVARAFSQAAANPSQAVSIIGGLGASHHSAPPPVMYNLYVPRPLYRDNFPSRSSYYASSSAFRQAERDRDRAHRELVKATERLYKADSAMLAQYNDRLKTSSEHALTVLTSATGLDFGIDSKAWGAWWENWNAFDGPIPATAPDPKPSPVAMARTRIAAGTPVKTERGLRPIEALKLGDRLLTRNPATGAFAHEPLVVLTPSLAVPMIGISLVGGGSIEVSEIQRLWVAGNGWTPARDLKPGAVLRTLEGRAAIAAITPPLERPGYNVALIENHSLFVGEKAVLAHDNTIVHPPSHPFDVAAEATANR